MFYVFVPKIDNRVTGQNESTQAAVHFLNFGSEFNPTKQSPFNFFDSELDGIRARKEDTRIPVLPNKPQRGIDKCFH